MKIVGNLTQVAVDPSPYKQYSPVLNFYGVQVELEVAEQDVVRKDDGAIVLDLDGLMAILSQIGDAIQDMHFDRQHNK